MKAIIYGCFRYIDSPFNRQKNCTIDACKLNVTNENEAASLLLVYGHLSWWQEKEKI